MRTNINQLIVPINVADIQPMHQANNHRKGLQVQLLLFRILWLNLQLMCKLQHLVEIKLLFGRLSLINPNNDESQTRTPAQIQRHSIPTSVGAMYAAAYAQKCITRVYIWVVVFRIQS